jgi:curved DNA-binding protein
MEYHDYYKILGVERNSSTDEIKRAFRKLALKYHPDRNPGDKQAEERFKEINEAYQVLSDSQKRARYDQLGADYSQWQQNGAPGNYDWGRWTSGAGVQEVDLNDLFGSGGFSDFFRSIFGGMDIGQAMGGRSSRVAPAYQQPVGISLREAFTGTTRTLQTDRRRVNVKIPAGVRTGTKIRVPAAGPNRGNAKASDIYLVVQVGEDLSFRREGDNLHAHVTIDIFKAILGGEVEVNTLSGKVILTIPPGTQPDQVFRVTGRGMPVLKRNNAHGDLFIEVKVQVPKDLTSKEKSLLEEVVKLRRK